MQCMYLLSLCRMKLYVRCDTRLLKDFFIVCHINQNALGRESNSDELCMIRLEKSMFWGRTHFIKLLYSTPSKSWTELC